MKRNPYLRVKLKSLAEEARIIRVEEARANANRDYQLQNRLRNHRVEVVRPEARYTLLAYQYLRGKSYDSCETDPIAPPNWRMVASMVRRFGGKAFDEEKWVKGELLKAA